MSLLQTDVIAASAGSPASPGESLRGLALVDAMVYDALLIQTED